MAFIIAEWLALCCLVFGSARSIILPIPSSSKIPAIIPKCSIPHPAGRPFFMKHFYSNMIQ